MVYCGLCHRIVRRTSLRWVCVGTPSPKRDGDDEVRPGLSCLPSENNEEGDMDVSNFSYRANLSTIPRDQHQRECGVGTLSSYASCRLKRLGMECVMARI